ncbi:bifunctional 3'-5' exonuclease/ATP-dependent helicase WRN-like isoform X2 [Arctopsyche grandis]
MQDQVRQLKTNNIASCFIASVQENKQEIVQNLLNGYYRLLYITPESATNSFGLTLLKNLHAKIEITLIAIDEAQCILHWGQNFRPSYKKLIKIRSIMPKIPIMALTASTTSEEKQIIINNLKLKNVQHVHNGYDRTNLYFAAKKMTKEPYGDILNVLSTEALNNDVADGSVIIYCLTKSITKKIANALNSMGVHCEEYHSGLDPSERSQVLHNFMNDKTKTIVATTAFGLGVNKSDVRIIIHYGTSLNIENYFQEVGRAGRDGKKSLCVLFYSVYDFSIHRYLNKKYDIKNEIDSTETNLMKHYISSTNCRRQMILSHFEKSNYDKTIFKHNCCDNCTFNLSSMKKSVQDCTYESELFLKTILSLHPKSYGIKTIISLLLGLKRKNILSISNDNELFGVGGNKCEDWWKQLALMLETQNYIKITTKMVGSILYSKAVLDSKGKFWLQNKMNGNVIPIIMEDF